jgi:flagellar biosynthesis protein
MEKKHERKEAAVLKYDKDKAVPKVVAQGKGIVAEKIIEVAEEESIPIYKDPDLAHALNLLQFGDEIPPELYEVVAQILVFVGDIDKLKELTEEVF